MYWRKKFTRTASQEFFSPDQVQVQEERLSTRSRGSWTFEDIPGRIRGVWAKKMAFSTFEACNTTMVAFLTIATALITVLTVLTYFHVRPPKAYCRRRFPCFFEDETGVKREGEAMTPDARPTKTMTVATTTTSLKRDSRSRDWPDHWLCSGDRLFLQLFALWGKKTPKNVKIRNLLHKLFACV